MKKAAIILVALICIFASTTEAGPIAPYKVRRVKGKIEKLYRYKDTLGICNGCMVYSKVICAKQKGVTAGEALAGDAAIDDEIIEFGFKEDGSDAPSWSKETSDDNEEQTEETPENPKKVTKITYTEEEGSASTNPEPTRPSKPVPQAPPTDTDCYQKQLTKFYTDSSLTDYKLVGLEIKTGTKADTFVISDTLKGCTTIMNVTSLPRVYNAPGKPANNGAKPTPFTEALFSSGVSGIALSRYTIVVTKTKNYDPCRTREVITKKLWQSIKRAADGKGSH